jgi:glycosyltransferase involved in cell wall biosynthesis
MATDPSVGATRDHADRLRSTLAEAAVVPLKAVEGAETEVASRGPMRILAFAYACQPGKGSEPGAGWAWSRMLARLGETWVITRRDYQPSIEEALRSVPERNNLHFLYVDLPDVARSWQRGLRGLRVYYLLWQVAALRQARRLRRSMRFDVVWHLTWANAWVGSLGAFAGRPFVYGPVGGCVNPSWRFLPHLGWSGAAYEVGRVIARGTSRYLNPLARLSWNRADLILAQNPETRNWFPRAHRPKTTVFPNAVIDEELIASVADCVPAGPPRAVYAGRLEPWKGAFLCLHALTLLPDWRLVICGSGSDEARLRRLTRRLGIDDRVEWHGWLPQEELFKRVAEADVFLFPCLREEAGTVIAEARALGLPIVSLARGGPRILAGSDGLVADSGRAADVVQRLVNTTLMSFERRRSGDVDGHAEALFLVRRADSLQKLLSEALGRSRYGERTSDRI